MAHFAQLDENDNVINVIVVNNNELLDESGVESEIKGINFLKSLFGQNTRWIQTSYNGNIRKNYASIGYKYDSRIDAFVPPKDYPSWILNDNTGLWEAPIAKPEDGKFYNWNEETKTWDEIVFNEKYQVWHLASETLD